MSSVYGDPRDFVLHVRSELLDEYLQTRHDLHFPLSDGKESREECADRFIEFMRRQEERKRDLVFMELEYINLLSSENHINAICSASYRIDREEMEKHCKRHDERALWTFTHFPEEFDHYYEQAAIEDIGGVKEITLPKTVSGVEINVAEKIDAFGRLVQDIYRKSLLKGEKCKVKTFENKGSLIFRVYLEDLPTRNTVFVEDRLDEKNPYKSVFNILFIYNESMQTLGVRAMGGKKIVNQLQKLFCLHFLGTDNINTEEDRFTLATVSKLSNLDLVADESLGVERAYLKSIRLEHQTVKHRLFIDIGSRTQYQGVGAVRQVLQELNLDQLDEWMPTSIQITVVFKQTGKGRQKKVTVTVTPPNTCDLKNREQDNIVRQLLRNWGIDVH